PWPADGLRLTGLKTAVRDARLLNGGQRIAVRTEPGGAGAPVVVLARPAHLDSVATVAALRLAGPPEVESASPVARADAQGVLTLKAADAEIHGQNARLQGDGENENIGYWVNRDDFVAWDGMVERPGRYAV